MERDRRGQQLCVVGTLLTLVSLVLSLAATSSSHWAEFRGPEYGYFGPWKVCTRQKCGGANLQPSFITVISGIGSAASTILLTGSFLLCPILLVMHSKGTTVALKFRHATLYRMICNALAWLCSVISVVAFILEVSVFRVGVKMGYHVVLGWSFYVQVISLLVCGLATAGSIVEWHWSRRLGGDPTMRGRDPEGTRANTISNPHFKDSVRNGHSRTGSHRGGSGRGSHRSSSHRSSNGHHHHHRHNNGISMTRLSGQPYMVTMPDSNGHVGNGWPGGVIPFDPNKTPGRSSLRKPKPAAPTEDSTDASMGIQNPAFAQSSPPPKKKVRIQTQSTAV